MEEIVLAGPASRDGPGWARGEPGPQLGRRAWPQPERFGGWRGGGWPLFVYSFFHTRYQGPNLGERPPWPVCLATCLLAPAVPTRRSGRAVGARRGMGSGLCWGLAPLAYLPRAWANSGRLLLPGGCGGVTPPPPPPPPLVASWWLAGVLLPLVLAWTGTQLQTTSGACLAAGLEPQGAGVQEDRHFGLLRLAHAAMIGLVVPDAGLTLGPNTQSPIPGLDMM
ncbi:hypothetical protein NDU88_002566 [Pleurodeles waltl]|uniref:Uncharacterized protein n=1 Tax=Pleurodeles waltl TaxID=8319 RepID=A0AAV7LCU8_PLEWA|nr:hypothetical protein NDU88_002566 [Pleurodeles waltl]